MQQRRLDEAVALYTRIIRSNPRHVEARKERGRVLGWLQRYDEALADFETVLDVAPRDVEARVGRGRVLG
ncbi:MAG TPA: tetratricopeptide repeat protein, partial [Candidatus Tectomicrobia bacterium]|nr:tetratricopeptide repeat protein [Candidatus Tectomicrobia bacterium]